MADRFQERNWDPWERSERETAAFTEGARGIQGSRYPTFGSYQPSRFGSIPQNPTMFGQPFFGIESYPYGQFFGQGYGQLTPYNQPLAQTFTPPFGVMYGNPYLPTHPSFVTGQPFIQQHPISYMHPYLQSQAAMMQAQPFVQQPVTQPVIPGFAPAGQIPQNVAAIPPQTLPLFAQHPAQIYGQQFAQMQQPLQQQLTQTHPQARFAQQLNLPFGPFSGRGPRGYRKPDERIKEDVIERLTADPLIDASNLEVIVKDAEVTLRGTVEDREQKRLAEEIAEFVFGARDIQNQIRVEPPQWVSQYQQTGTTGRGMEKEKEGELVGAGSRGKEK